MRIDLKDPGYTKELKKNMHLLFDSPQGKEVMAFLESTCSWYQSIFDPTNRDMALINDGKRQVLATIKSILAMSEEEIVAWIKEREE